MNNMPLQNNHSKNLVRSKVISLAPKSHVVLDIPGPEIMSPIELINQKKLDKKTIVHTIERDKKANKTICKKLKNRRVLHVPHEGSLENFESDLFFDFVNLDTCSSLNEGIIKTVSNLKFNQNATFALWVTGFRAKGELKAKILSYAAKWSDNTDYIRNVTFIPNLSKINTSILVVLASCLKEYEFEVSFYDYISNKTKMNVFVLSKIRPAQEKRSKISFEGEQSYTHEKKKYTSTKQSSLSGTMPNQFVQAFENNKLGQINHLKTKARQEINNRQKNKKWILAGWKSNVSKICKNKTLAKKIHDFISSI